MKDLSAVYMRIYPEKATDRERWSVVVKYVDTTL